MLRQIRVRNFVHFEEEKTFTFDKGSHFFIGENGSGKTCTFEALRRCLSTSKNFLVSTSHNIDAESVVLCKFAKVDDEKVTIYSGYVRLLNGEQRKNIDVKIVCEIKDNEVQELFVDLTKANVDGLVTNEEIESDGEDLLEELKKVFNKMVIDFEALIACVRDKIKGIKSVKEFQRKSNESNGYTNTTCEKYLKEHIDKYVVITDPMRSIGCLEWTNSERLEPDQHIQKGKQILKDMQKRCEILHWYFRSKDSIDPTERKLVKTYFETLTDTIPLRFEYENGNIVVIDNDKYVSLEKVPEGIFEAKICAILLAMKQFQTVCLDEPSHGMHPQMAERMRDLILRKIKSKTVIATSHSPSFLAAWNIPQTYFFQVDYGTKDNKKIKFRIIPGKRLLSNDEKKTPRLITSQHFPSLFFARRLFIVEGDGEYFFLSAIKSILLDDDKLLAKILKKTGSITEHEIVVRYLSSLHVLPLNGEPNKVRIETICMEMNKERYFMLDFDALLQDKSNIEDTQKFFDDFHLIKTEFDRRRMVYLEENGIFVFERSKQDTVKKGTIEDAFVCFTMNIDSGKTDKGGRLEDFFDQQNLKLKWNRNSRNEKKNKLFNDLNLTDENINEIVKKVLNVCAHSENAVDTELFRLVRFLIRRIDDVEANQCV